MKTRNACFMRWFVGFVAICYALFCMTFCMSQHHIGEAFVVKRIWLAVLKSFQFRKTYFSLGGKEIANTSSTPGKKNITLRGLRERERQYNKNMKSRFGINLSRMSREMNAASMPSTVWLFPQQTKSESKCHAAKYDITSTRYDLEEINQLQLLWDYI